MFIVYLIKVVWEFGVEMLAFALALIKCCWVAKCLEKLFYENMAECIKYDRVYSLAESNEIIIFRSLLTIFFKVKNIFWRQLDHYLKLT